MSKIAEEIAKNYRESNDVKQFISDSLVLAIVANPCEPLGEEAILVEVNIPEPIKNVLKMIAEVTGASLAKVETTFVNECYLQSITQRAKSFFSRYEKVLDGK